MEDKNIYKEAIAMSSKDKQHGLQQLRYWKIVSFLCLTIVTIQSIFIGYLLTKNNNMIYVARVAASDSIKNVVSINNRVTAKQTEKLAFIASYIQRLVAMPLDPVLVKKNWLENYQDSGINARQSLTRFIHKYLLTDKVGKETDILHIHTFNRVTNNSYQFTWDVATYDLLGNKLKTIAYSGVFTLATMPLKTLNEHVLSNPFGLQIESFSVNQLGA